MRDALNITVPTIGEAVGARAPIDAQRSATGASPLVCEIQIAGAPHAMSLELPSAAPGGQNVVVQLTIGGEAASATAATPPVHTRAISASIPDPIQASIPDLVDFAIPPVEESLAPAPIDPGSFADTLVSHGEPSAPISSIPTSLDASFPASQPVHVQVMPGREGLDQRLPRITAEELESYAPEACEVAVSQESLTYESIFELEPIDAHQEMLAGFREADRVRSRRVRRLRVASVSAMAALGFCFCAAGLTGIFFEEGLPIGATQASPTEQLVLASDEESGEGELVASGETELTDDSGGNVPATTAAQPNDKSGTVEYSYVATAAEGGQVKATETVAFDPEGYAEISHMDLVFDSEDAAQAFMSRVSRDYGESYLGGAVDGTAVEVRIDVSENRLNRNAYKRALSGTVQELTAVDGLSTGTKASDASS